MDDATRIAATDDVPTDGSLLFRVRDESDEVREVILLRESGTVVAWRNQCQHFTHVSLDKGSGVPRRNGELVCANHGALFDVESGECTHGPCVGASLVPVEVRVADGAVFLADDEYAFAGLGGVERDDADLTSTSNVEF